MLVDWLWCNIWYFWGSVSWLLFLWSSIIHPPLYRLLPFPTQISSWYSLSCQIYFTTFFRVIIALLLEHEWLLSNLNYVLPEIIYTPLLLYCSRETSTVTLIMKSRKYCHVNGKSVQLVSKAYQKSKNFKKLKYLPNRKRTCHVLLVSICALSWSYATVFHNQICPGENWFSRSTDL